MLKFKLGIKGVPRKKIISYIILIVLSMAGAGFFVYQNKKLTSSSIMGNNLVETGMDASENIIERTKSITTKAIHQLDIKILSNEKFKALKEVFLKEIKVDIGRGNPFENPYSSEDEE